MEKYNIPRYENVVRHYDTLGMGLAPVEGRTDA